MFLYFNFTCMEALQKRSEPPRTWLDLEVYIILVTKDNKSWTRQGKGDLGF